MRVVVEEEGGEAANDFLADGVLGSTASQKTHNGLPNGRGDVFGKMRKDRKV